VKEYLDLILTFVKIGCMTFGGGYAMIPVLEREIIHKKGWITMEDLMDYYTIAQITPGVIAVNTATFIGCRRRGPLGGIVSTVGFLVPGICVMIVFSLFIKRFAEYPLVQHVFAGVRIAVGALILDTLMKLLKGLFRDPASVVIFILGFSLQAVFSASPVLIVAGAGAAGLFLYSRKTKTRGSPAGEDKG
jgi:chromate transporter